MSDHETRTEASSFSLDESTFKDLRKSISSIAGDLKQVAESGGRAVKEQTEEGVQSLRQSIRRQPAMAMGIALLTGVALALFLVPSFARRTSSRWVGWMPSISRADLYDFAAMVQRRAMLAANSVPVASSLERLADAVSRIEPSASLNSAIEKIGSWLEKVRGSKAD
jgi:hypothetical protein